MILTQGLPAYRGSRGQGEFVLPSGRKVIFCADDQKITAELAARGHWSGLQPEIALRRSIAFIDRTPAGVDMFVWIGHAEDGGLVWYAFPGARRDSPDIQAFWAWVTQSLFQSRAPATMAGLGYGLS